MTYYHYCSTETFRQIMTNKTVWLSSLKSSNDSMEGKWTASIIRLVAEETGVPASDFEEFSSLVNVVEDIFDCLGFCMSGDKDMLSQWRGYADDGRGVSIGFSDSFLARVVGQPRTIRLHHVVYDLAEQKQIVAETVSEAKKLIEAGALRKPSRGTVLTPKTTEEFGEDEEHYRKLNNELFFCLTLLEKSWFSLKNPAFKEENEVRLSRTFWQPEPTDYRTFNGRLVPYTIVPFPEMPNGEPIIEQIVLGPKNTTPLHVVNGFLRRCGFHDVPVDPSSASYR